MDAVCGLLEGVRAHGAFVLRTVMAPPWSMRIEDEAPLTVAAVVRGEAWIVPDDGDPVRLTDGDVVLVRGPGHYVVADRPSTEPTVVVHPGQRCTTLAGDDLALAMALGVRTWGNELAGETVLVTGTYEGHSEMGRRLLDALPPVVVVADDPDHRSLVDLLSAEIGRDRPGQEVVLDRLLDLLLVSVVRTWLAQAGAEAPAWWRADHDPIVGPALRSIYDDPAHPWTIAELARSVGASRAAFARRFADLVGEPPISFLTSWRLTLAADLLRAEPSTTIGAVAQRVGYGSPFALSAAFKRRYGVSPHHHRHALAASA